METSADFGTVGAGGRRHVPGEWGNWQLMSEPETTRVGLVTRLRVEGRHAGCWPWCQEYWALCGEV